MREMEFKGKCIGVRLTPRGDTSAPHTPQPDTHILITLMVEDDGNWFEKDFCVSSSWLNEMIDVLTAAKNYCETQEPDISTLDGKQYGWRFK